MFTDLQLLARYLSHEDQQAFRELVNRHIDMVHGTAVRSLANPQDAADVVQAVFLLLSRKAYRIPQSANLAGWLFRATRYCCNSVNRSNAARLRREREAAMRRDSSPSIADDWQPMLDEALERLSEKERQAILLHYLENKSVAQTSDALAISFAATEKRLQRGLEKLRVLLARRGFVVPSAMLTTGLLAQGAKAAPLGLAAAVAPASATPAVIGITKSAALMMKLAAMKWAVAACVVFLIAASAALAFKGTPPAAPLPVATTPVSATAPAVPISVPKKQITHHAIIRDEHGKPIPNAKAWLERISYFDSDNVQIEAQTTSGPDGSIALGPVEDIGDGITLFANRTLIVDVPGKAWAWWETRKVSPYDDQPVGQIVATAPESIAGIVVNEDGQPIAGATVSLVIQHYYENSYVFSRSRGRAVTTDHQGRFLIPRVPAGIRAHAVVEAPGYATHDETSTTTDGPIPAGADDVRIVMKRGASVTVQLTRDGWPYRKAGVMVKCADDDNHGDIVASNEAGQVVFDGLKPDQYTFRGVGDVLIQEQLVGQRTEPITVQAGETRSIDLACVQGRLLRGQVVREGNAAWQTVLWMGRSKNWIADFIIELPADGCFTTVVGDEKYYLMPYD
ncbi:MAG: sigma-70 family RNA polymerase sigma factor, partial [Phycisphaerales bacterium]|nr:sigma-70 family RNA polymerase sigma factor [Phycisphaerales bacterium]